MRYQEKLKDITGLCGAHNDAVRHPRPGVESAMVTEYRIPRATAIRLLCTRQAGGGSGDAE
jgi:hypothetical protein